MAKLTQLLLTLKGSSKSGNWGHKGRLGRRGGSSSSYSSASRQELENHYSQYTKDCNSPECASLYQYTKNSNRINDLLREGPSPNEDWFDKKKRLDSEKYIADIDQAMNQGPKVPENMIVFRQISNLDSFKEGEVFQNKAYTSTNISKTDENLEIRIPKGSKGIYLGNMSDWKDENEFLLPRNSKFKVVEKTGNSAIVELIDD